MYHEKFTTRRELAETLSEELDSASDEMTVYVDLTAQNVLLSIPTIISGESNAEYNGHEVVDGKIVCYDKSAISIYEAEEDDYED